MSATLLAATGNAHKIEEMSAILAPHQITLISPKTLEKPLPEVVEDADTFEGNAAKKACEIAAATGQLCIADDSGLAVDALDGAPGVYSARYAGEHASDQDNVIKLLNNLKGVTNRKARFVCVIAIASPNGLIGSARGEVTGHIIEAPRGDSGFGYDPVFVPDGYQETFAELGAAVKDSISHRGNALKKIIETGIIYQLPN